LDDKLYVFGGCGAKGRMHDLYAYDIQKACWEEFPEEKAMKVGKEKKGKEGKGCDSLRL